MCSVPAVFVMRLDKSANISIRSGNSGQLSIKFDGKWKHEWQVHWSLYDCILKRMYLFAWPTDFLELVRCNVLSICLFYCSDRRLLGMIVCIIYTVKENCIYKSCLGVWKRRFSIIYGGIFRNVVWKFVILELTQTYNQFSYL